MLKLKCPICKEGLQIESDTLTCKNDHRFNKLNGVYRLMTPSFSKKIDLYLKSFNEFRSRTSNGINENNVTLLPYISFNKKLWRLRIIDLNLIKKLFDKHQPTSVLDFGAWNGWLSHNISKWGANVVALDYFTKPFDGLETVSYYENKFLAIQASLDNLNIFESKFDLIIINRCLPYFSDLNNGLNDLKKLLSPNGIIIITGINKINSSKLVKKKLQATNDHFLKHYEQSLFFKKFKGYIENDDISIIKQNGFKIFNYKPLLLKSILSYFNPTKVNYLYAIHQKS